MSNSVRPQRWQPTRLPCPWDSPGKNTGMGCHFLLQCVKVKSEREVVQSCPTLSDPTDYSLPGSSVHGIFQARVLEWGAIALVRAKNSSQEKEEQSRRKKQLTNSCFFTQRKYMEVVGGGGTNKQKNGYTSICTLLLLHTHMHTHTHTQSRRNSKILGWPESSFRVSIRSNFLANPILKVVISGWSRFQGGPVINNPPAKQETQRSSLGQEDPLEKEMATYSVLVWEIP